MRAIRPLLLLLSLVALLVGCSAGNPATPPTASPQGTSAETALAAPSEAASPEAPSQAPYPAPEVSASTEPYPGANSQEALQEMQAALPTLAPLGEPAPGKGHLLGQIMRESEIRPREPLAGWTLYLAQVQRNVSGEIVPLASVVEELAPTAITDRDGRFAFADVEPGLYALVIKHPLTLVLARDLQTDQDVVVEVIADQVVQEPLVVVTISD